jgi:uncharacterized damage-inducible protein DinB
MTLRDHWIQMARNNAWSNLRLYGACRTLDHAALTATRTSFFPTILSTLQHIWIVDEFYVDGLEGAGRGAAIWGDEGNHAQIDSLWKAQRAVDRRLLAYCDRARTDGDSATSVTLQRPGGPKVDSAGDILAHLFVHQIHHRGQVHAMLSGTSVAPPQLDEWFLAMDRPIAERELAAASATPEIG